MIIEEIEKQIINLLPTSNILLDEVDYSILEERKKELEKTLGSYAQYCVGV